jgi:hypothetical protein
LIRVLKRVWTFFCAGVFFSVFLHALENGKKRKTEKKREKERERERFIWCAQQCFNAQKLVRATNRHKNTLARGLSRSLFYINRLISRPNIRVLNMSNPTLKLFPTLT